jgi:hypothetical protein
MSAKKLATLRHNAAVKAWATRRKAAKAKARSKGQRKARSGKRAA